MRVSAPRPDPFALHPAQGLELVVEGAAQAPASAAVRPVDQPDVVNQDVPGAHGNWLQPRKIESGGLDLLAGMALQVAARNRQQAAVLKGRVVEVEVDVESQVSVGGAPVGRIAVGVDRHLGAVAR